MATHFTGLVYTLKRSGGVKLALWTQISTQCVSDCCSAPNVNTQTTALEEAILTIITYNQNKYKCIILREHRMGNQKWTIQRHWQHRLTKDEDKQN